MAAPAQQQQGSDTSLGPVWIIIAIFIVAGVIWMIFRPQMIEFILHLKLSEIKLLSLFTNNLDYEAAWINYIRASQLSDNLTLMQVIDLMIRVGKYLSYPIAFVLGCAALIMFLGYGGSRLKKTYSMNSLVAAEKYEWPQITPVVDLDLINEDIHKGPWAMALTPMQFAKKHKLLREEHIVVEDAMSPKDRHKIIAILQRAEAHRIFTMQLGNYWQGPEKLSPHLQALFAAFAARANRDRDAPEKLLAQIAASTATGKLDFSGATELMDKYKNTKIVQEVMQRHAFELTVMASMLQLGRQDGVIASAEFLWLKPVDRRLWYMLNSVGRQTPYVEVGGPFAHWLAELEAGRKLNVPMVEEAVNALELAINEIVYVPDEEK